MAVATAAAMAGAAITAAGGFSLPLATHHADDDQRDDRDKHRNDDDVADIGRQPAKHIEKPPLQR